MFTQVIFLGIPLPPTLSSGGETAFTSGLFLVFVVQTLIFHSNFLYAVHIYNRRLKISRADDVVSRALLLHEFESGLALPIQTVNYLLAGDDIKESM